MVASTREGAGETYIQEDATDHHLPNRDAHGHCGQYKRLDKAKHEVRAVPFPIGLGPRCVPGRDQAGMEEVKTQRERDGQDAHNDANDGQQASKRLDDQRRVVVIDRLRHRRARHALARWQAGTH